MAGGVLGEPGASVRGHVVQAYQPIAGDVITQGRKQYFLSELSIVSELSAVSELACFNVVQFLFQPQKRWKILPRSARTISTV